MAKSTNPFRYFDSSPEVIRTVVTMYVKHPLSLRNVEDLLAERASRAGVEVVVTDRGLGTAFEFGPEVGLDGLDTGQFVGQQPQMRPHLCRVVTLPSLGEFAVRCLDGVEGLTVPGGTHGTGC